MSAPRGRGAWTCASGDALRLQWRMWLVRAHTPRAPRTPTDALERPALETAPRPRKRKRKRA